MASTTLTFDLIAHDRASYAFDHVGTSAAHSTEKLRAFAKYGALALAAATVVAVRGLTSATKAAMEDQAAQAKLAAQLKSSANATDSQIAATESWIDMQARATGVADDELRPALSALVTATGDVSKAQTLLSLAMDISAARGKSLQSVSEALMKAQNGSISGLSRLGIATKNAAGETLTFDQAVRQMSDTFGGAAATQADTFQGKMNRLKVVFDESKEALGNRLIPVLTKFADWFLDDGLPAITKMSNNLQTNLGPAFQAVGRFISNDAVPALRKVGGWIQDMGPTIIAFSQNALAGLQKAWANVKTAMKDAGPFFKLVEEGARGVWKVVGPYLGPALMWLAKNALPALTGNLKIIAKILGAVGKAGIWMWNNALQPVFKMLFQAVSLAMQKFGELLQILGKAPHMGWVGDLGDKLVNAAAKANALAAGIERIDTQKTVRIDVVTYHNDVYGGQAGGGGHEAPGSAPRVAPRMTGRPSGKTLMPTVPAGRRTAGGGDLVGALVAALSGMELRVVGLDAGQRAYLQGATL